MSLRSGEGGTRARLHVDADFGVTIELAENGEHAIEGQAVELCISDTR
jgi:hypothetical protein